MKILSNALHIVYNDAAKKTLSIGLDMESIPHTIISLNDDLRLGPIQQLDTEEGLLLRAKWLKKVCFNACDKENIVLPVHEDISKIATIKAKVGTNKTTYIWCGRTSLDRVCTARLLYDLTDFENTFITAIPNVTFKNDFGYDYVPRCLNVMAPKNIPLIFPYFKIVDEHIFNDFKGLWEVLLNENKPVRLTGSTREIISAESDAFDEVLLKNCPDTFTKSARVIGYSLMDIDFEATDSMLNWRLIALAKSKKVAYEGELKMMRDYSVKRI